MSSELDGGLIQMTAHMETASGAAWMISVGAIVALAFAALAFCAAVSRRKSHRTRYVAAFAAIALLGVALIVSGAKTPRVKILYCCADGPVDLQVVAARYDIREVDGKLLVLAER